MNDNHENVKDLKIKTIATDPVYIGTGGFNIGRVDNTIVRDPITKIPKIPGTSLAGTWRYYMILQLLSKIKNFQPDKIENVSNMNGKNLEEKIKKWIDDNGQKWNSPGLHDWYKYSGNIISNINCSGQDNQPQNEYESPYGDNNTGHCGHCIVCKSFGFSKKNLSSQGQLFFSDLNILFFPVYTRFGVKWITSYQTLKEAGLLNEKIDKENEIKTLENKVILCKENFDSNKKDTINLGWINLPYEEETIKFKLNDKDDTEIKDNIIDNIVIVPDDLISQIINSNLEVRTSVSIDPITGAAKEGALFTSEAIPRSTVFYGSIRIFDKKQVETNNKINYPEKDKVEAALKDSRHYYETLGIGGMTTRGFGRISVIIPNSNDNNNGGNNAKS